MYGTFIGATSASNSIQFGHSNNIMKLHSDGDEEYKAWRNHFGGMGGVNQFFLPPYTPEHIEIAKRMNHTVGDASRAMLVQANLPAFVRPYGLKHDIFIRNRAQHAATGTTPHFGITNENPNL